MKKVTITFEIRGWDDCPDLSPILEGATETAGDLADHIEANGGPMSSDWLIDQLEEHVSVEWDNGEDEEAHCE
jgi:hypothetical protein